MNRIKSGPVAQWLEQPAHNRSVAGPIPARPTILNDHRFCPTLFIPRIFKRPLLSKSDFLFKIKK